MFVLDVVGTQPFEHHVGGRVATLGRLDPARELAVEFQTIFARGVASRLTPRELRVRCDRQYRLQHRKTRACYYGSGKRPAQEFAPCVSVHGLLLLCEIEIAAYWNALVHAQG